MIDVVFIIDIDIDWHGLKQELGVKWVMSGRIGQNLREKPYSPVSIALPSVKPNNICITICIIMFAPNAAELSQYFQENSFIMR